VCSSAPADAPRRSKRIGGCECHGPGTCYSFNGDAIDALLMASTSPRRERVSGRTGCRSTRILADLWRDTCVLLCAPKLEHRVPVGPSKRETGIYIHSRRPVPVLTSARAFYRRALKQSPCTIDGRNGNDRVWIHAIAEFDRSPNRTDRERVFSSESIPSDGSFDRDRVFLSASPDVLRKRVNHCRTFPFPAPVYAYTHTHARARARGYMYVCNVRKQRLPV